MEWSSYRNTGPKRECSTEAGKPVFEIMGTTEFIFWLFLFFIIWKKFEVRDPEGLRREENRKLLSQRVLGHGTTVFLGPFKFRFLHFKKFPRACMIVHLDWKTEEEARSWRCVQENFHNHRPWHLNRMRKGRAQRGEGQRTSDRINGQDLVAEGFGAEGTIGNELGRADWERSVRCLRSLVVVYLRRDKDQRLTLGRLAEIGVNMKSLEGSTPKTNEGSV